MPQHNALLSEKALIAVANPIEVKVPDIGDFKDVEVIEVLVKAGDTVDKEQSLVTLESDKATMEIPSPEAGVVKALKLQLGDKVSQGSLILLLETERGEAKAAAPQAAAPAKPAPAPAAGGSALQPQHDCAGEGRLDVGGGGQAAPAGRANGCGAHKRGEKNGQAPRPHPGRQRQLCGHLKR